MSEQKKSISIWFFIGVEVLIYGLLIAGSGIYEYLYPPKETFVQLAYLHAPIWWGGLLIVLGTTYTIVFRPKKSN
jgi:heme/copper-type cytochrome/quinol oxidase subunit 3